MPLTHYRDSTHSFFSHYRIDHLKLSLLYKENNIEAKQKTNCQRIPHWVNFSSCFSPYFTISHPPDQNHPFHISIRKLSALFGFFPVNTFSICNKMPYKAKREGHMDPPGDTRAGVVGKIQIKRMNKLLNGPNIELQNQFGSRQKQLNPLNVNDRWSEWWMVWNEINDWCWSGWVMVELERVASAALLPFWP